MPGSPLHHECVSANNKAGQDPGSGSTESLWHSGVRSVQGPGHLPQSRCTPSAPHSCSQRPLGGDGAESGCNFTPLTSRRVVGKTFGRPVSDTQGACRTQPLKCFYPSCRQIGGQSESRGLGSGNVFCTVTGGWRSCFPEAWVTGVSVLRGLRYKQLSIMRPGLPRPCQS